MDFSDTKEEAEYRATACAWLGETAELKRPGSTFKAKYGADDLVPLAKEWQAKKFAAGYAGITLPRNYGGQGGTQLQQVIYEANWEKKIMKKPINTPTTSFGNYKTISS